MTNNKKPHVKTERQIEVLKAADRVHVNGAVNAGDIARELGDTAPGATNRVNQIIVTLRKHGEWPYQPMSIPRAKEILDFNGSGDPELDVLSECYRRLCTLTTQERARVLRYLGDRLEPVGTIGMSDPPSPEGDGFLKDACLSPTTLPSTGYRRSHAAPTWFPCGPQRSEPATVCAVGISTLAGLCPEPQGDAIQGRPWAPIGLDTDQATEAHDRDFDLGYCFTRRPSLRNRQQQVVKEQLRFY